MARKDSRVILSDFDLTKVSDDWLDLQGAGMTIWGAHENNRWLLGDLGVKLVGRFKKDAVKKFCYDISQGALNHTTFYDYTATSAVYSPEDRVAFPNLSWSHYRQAKGRVLWNEDGSQAVGEIRHDIAMVWLSKAADNEWSVAALKAAMEEHANPKVGGGKPPKPEMLVGLAGQFVECAPAEGEGEISYYVSTIITHAPIQIPPRQVYDIQFYGVPQDDIETD